MKTLRFIFIDQLSDSLSALKDADKSDTILFCESMQESKLVNHHPKKLAFLFASMRHFAQSLKEKGYQIRYLYLDEKGNSGDLTKEISQAIKDLDIERLVVTEPSEYRLKKMATAWSSLLGVAVEIREDDRFLCSIGEFKEWAAGKKQLRMEYFYREMRKKHGILLEEDGSPCGGEWNYDKENRKPPSTTLRSPTRISHKKSAILIETLKLVGGKFSDHFGDLEPFHYAVTRDQALIELDDFIDRILPYFGDYQDAMVKGEAYLNHSLLSSYINAGLLLPLEICQKAESAYRSGKAPLNACEGFIRQILGWREYVRGIYWLKMPEYADLNYLDAKTALPAFFWGGKTEMSCISDVIAQTKEHAYSHHIQRLMVTGNFAMIAGLDVKEVQKWYLEVYSDAYEWVEMPNTLGMALFGDGGILGSKPYAASGKYINKMSNFCKSCPYNPENTTEEDACPFNALYWDFLVRNRAKLEANHRLFYVYSTWDKFTESKQAAIRKKATRTLELMQKGAL